VFDFGRVAETATRIRLASLSSGGAVPTTHYAHKGDLSIAYAVIGSGDLDLVVVPGFVSHLDGMWQLAGYRQLIERLATFSRVIVFDKSGTGLSDPVATPGTLEERADDLRAVMEAVGSQAAVLLGISEGGAMAMVFAAAHPERTRDLILYGATPRFSRAPGYPCGPELSDLVAQMGAVLEGGWGEGVALEVFAPSHLGDPAFEDWWSRIQRSGASPAMARALFRMWAELDVRDVLDAIHVPTLVLHRRGDRLIDVSVGRYLAAHIAGARYVELDGDDHLAYTGDVDQLAAEIEEFVTGSRPRPQIVDRILATVLFVDVAGSTETAARVGDAVWASIRGSFLAAARAQLARYDGTEVDVAGDGLFATFAGPARAIRCALAIGQAAEGVGVGVRAGVHAGEVEREDGGGVSGLAVHIGARVMAEAEPGEVLVSGTVKDLVVGSGLGFADRGVHVLRGVPGSWALFAVTT
jgi:pimeloyl-ACP methyl ester carboxylesterase